MKKIVIMFTVIASLLSPFALSPAFVSADAFGSSEAKSQACSGINGCTSTTSLDTIVKAVLRILSIVAGIASVIMIVISGFKYITSGGDSGKISSAKNTLVYAIIGIIVVAFAQTISQFVIKQATTAPPKAKKAAYIVRMT